MKLEDVKIGATVMCPNGHKHTYRPSDNLGGGVYCTEGKCWSDGSQNDSGSGSHYDLRHLTLVQPNPTRLFHCILPMPVCCGEQMALMGNTNIHTLGFRCTRCFRQMEATVAFNEDPDTKMTPETRALTDATE